MKKYAIIMLVLLGPLAFAEGPSNARYISRYEASEMLQGEWEHYASKNWEYGHSFMHESPDQVSFEDDGSYHVNRYGAYPVEEGVWSIVEIGHHPWIRMRSLGSDRYLLFKLVFLGDRVKFYDPTLPGARGFDTEVFRRF